MTNFNIEIIFDDCTLQVEDKTCYPKNTCVVDFVAYVKDGVSTVSTKSKKISIGCEGRSYRYNPENDGKYIYYRVILPYYDLFDGCGYSVDIPYGYFVAENANGEKIICLNDKNSVSLKNNGENLNVTEITNYLDLITSGLVSADEYFSKEFFSICKLNSCVARLQKKYILSHIDDCGSTKCSKGSDSEKANRDFLFISSYILDFLISQGNFDQAEELLDKISSSCGSSLCGDSNNSNSCGCNG